MVTTVSVSVSVSSARPEDSTLDVLMLVCFGCVPPDALPTFLLPDPVHPSSPPSTLYHCEGVTRQFQNSVSTEEKRERKETVLKKKKKEKEKKVYGTMHSSR